MLYPRHSVFQAKVKKRATQKAFYRDYAPDQRLGQTNSSEQRQPRHLAKYTQRAQTWPRQRATLNVQLATSTSGSSTFFWLQHRKCTIITRLVGKWDEGFYALSC